MARDYNIASFDDITEDGRLWAVRYVGDEDNILDTLFAQWDDVQWLHALKLQDGNYIITGGAIKLTKTMQEREHTLRELYRQEQVRNFLLSHDIIDTDSFIDYLTEIK